jgi:hypothetical protein
MGNFSHVLGPQRPKVVEPKVKGHSKLERLVLIPDRPGREGRQMEDS